MRDRQQDKRQEARAAASAAVFLELEAEDPVLQLPARLLLCRLLDISASGMKIRIDRPLEVGAILSLCAQFADRDQALKVVGEVRWVRPDEDYFVAGFYLFDADQVDIDGWKAIAAQTSTSDGS